MMDPRLTACNLIIDWEEKKTFPNLALKNALRSVMNERDRRFITAVVYGVVERKLTLDYFLARCSDRKLERLAPAVLSVLRMGVYQLFYMQVPASAACNTSVDLIKKCGMAHSAGFVNAILRRCDRERDELLAMKKVDFSVRYSIAPALVDLLLEQYGKDTFKAMMDGISQPDTSFYLFHNLKRGTSADFEMLMRQENITLEKTELAHLYKVSSGFSVEHSKAYQEGWYHIVGRHSAEAALKMPTDASLVMDLCAAPGGKTFVMAALTSGEIRAFDIHSHKVENLMKSAKRLMHQNVTARQADASVFDANSKEIADFVLCDVPCSGLGIIGKKPDIKYKQYNSDGFTAIQYQILENGGRYLKNGGRLVYSTCTIDRRENEVLVDRFLKKNPIFTLVEQKLYLPECGSDGFFIAVIKKG